MATKTGKSEKKPVSDRAEGKKPEGKKADGSRDESRRDEGKRAEGKKAEASRGDAGEARVATGPAPAPRLRDHYRSQIVPELVKKFGYKSVMEVPRITKITVNMGVGETTQDKKILDNAVGDMTKITGQKPVITKARTSIATFKIRKGFPVGCMVTLRGARMYEFLDRFVTVALPRVRDFRGASNRAFDGRGNYSVGVKEQIIFPEIDYDKVDALRGMNVSITTTAKTDDEARALLGGFSFPFKTN
jgi:large subunit ribosomal protein L5